MMNDLSSTNTTTTTTAAPQLTDLSFGRLSDKFCKSVGTALTGVALSGVALTANHDPPSRVSRCQQEGGAFQVSPSRREDHLHPKGKGPELAVDLGMTIIVSQVTTPAPQVAHYSHW